MIVFQPKSKQANVLRRVSDCGLYIIVVSESRWISKRGPFGGKTGYWSGVGYDVTRLAYVGQHVSEGEYVGSSERYAEAVAAASAHRSAA